MNARLPPSEDVLTAFGVRGELVPLPGGEQRSYRCGDVVLRFENADDEFEAAWNAALFASIV